MTPAIHREESPSLVVIRRVATYLASHLFEAIALVFTCATALNYVFGRSYLDGWAQAAGVPANLFARDLYDAIFAGVQLRVVWFRVGLGAILLTAYLWIVTLLPVWWEDRRSSARGRYEIAHWKQRHLTWKRIGFRARLVARWRSLRPAYGQEQMTKGERPWRFPHAMTIILFLVIPLIGLSAALYKLADDFLLKEARREGIRSYAKTYLSVTGRLPYQFGAMTLPAADLKEWACEGRSILSNFRAVTLRSEDSPSLETFYVLQGADKTFVLLGKDGSTLRSFGDARFSLKESPTRPLADVAKSC